MLAQLGQSEGAVGARTAGIIVGATHLRELRADDVMLPRHEVVYLSGTESTTDIVDRIRRSRHSRFPFTPTESIDQCSGLVLAKELLLQLEASDDEVLDWSGLVRSFWRYQYVNCVGPVIPIPSAVIHVVRCLFKPALWSYIAVFPKGMYVPSRIRHRLGPVYPRTGCIKYDFCWAPAVDPKLR